MSEEQAQPKASSIRTLLHDTEPGVRVRADGWVKTRRSQKAFAFIELNDGSIFDNLQVIADAELPDYEQTVESLHPGAAISVVGTLAESPGKGQAVELQAETIIVHGLVDPEDYPLQKKRISFEKLREMAHLRVRTNTFGAIARLRHTLSFATHKFFDERGFFYVHTPIITASDCEGAGEMFQVSTLDMMNLPRTEGGGIDYSEDFFGREAKLTVSGQLSVETYCCALSKVYTFGPTFRAENSNTSRHLSEFWMIEPELAFADLAADADLAEDYLRYLFAYVLEHCAEDMAFFSKWVSKGRQELIEKLAESTFQRLEYSEAIRILAEADEAFEFPVEWGMDLQSEHERYLAEQHFKMPVTVINYPRDIKAFYMRQNDDGKTVAAMDVLLPEVGEIIGGSQREERLDVLEARLREMGLDPADYWWYLDLRRFGTVPHAGFGLGFERLVQFISGMQNIRDVIPFPRTPRHAEF